MSNLNAFAQHYLYAIVSADQAGSWGPIGINKATVSAIADGPVAAVVSPIAGQRVRPERANLAAHNGVLKLLMQDGPVLPVAFGTIARSAKTLRGMLARNQAVFLTQLDYVKGKVEMGLRVRFDVPSIYDYVLSLHPELRELRDAAYGNLRNPTRDLKIGLGREFEHLLEEERKTHTETVVAALSPHCVEIKTNPPRNEQEVVNLACLIGNEDLKAFEAAVLVAANRFDNNFAFNFTGPWAPYNFVDIKLGPGDVAGR